MNHIFRKTILTVAAFFLCYPASAGVCDTTKIKKLIESIQQDNQINEQVELFNVALKKRPVENIYHYAVKKLNVFNEINNRILYSWDFEYKGKQYMVYNHDLYIKSKSADRSSEIQYWNYGIYNKSDEFALDVNLMLADAYTVFWMLVPNGKTTITVYDNVNGKLGKKVFNDLKYRYNYTNPIIDRAKDGEVIDYYMYDNFNGEMVPYKSVVEKKEKFKIFHNYIRTEKTGQTFFDNNQHVLVDKNNGLSTKTTKKQALAERGQEISAQTLFTCLDYPIVDIGQYDSISLDCKFAYSAEGVFQNQKRVACNFTDEKQEKAIVTIKKEVPNNGAFQLDKGENWLEPSFMIESDAAEIKAKATQLTKSQPDTLKKCLLIADWISNGLKWTYKYSANSALETFNKMEGDCSEAANLFIAMCRSINIPAKMAMGYFGKECIGKHAWGKVVVNNQLVEIDPTTGKKTTALHIPMSENYFNNQITEVKLLKLYKLGKTIVPNKEKAYWEYKKGILTNNIRKTKLKIPKALEYVENKYAKDLMGLPKFQFSLDGNETVTIKVDVVDKYTDPNSLTLDNRFNGYSFTNFEKKKIVKRKGGTNKEYAVLFYTVTYDPNYYIKACDYWAEVELNGVVYSFNLTLKNAKSKGPYEVFAEIIDKIIEENR